MFVFDTSSFSILFRHFYVRRFPSLWNLLNSDVDDGVIVSVRACKEELLNGPFNSASMEWIEANKSIFLSPNSAEGGFIKTIYQIPKFQENVPKQLHLRSGEVADPYVIAKAAVHGGSVVTEEKMKPNAAKIPNICAHFGIGCSNLERFMEVRGWVF